MGLEETCPAAFLFAKYFEKIFNSREKQGEKDKYMQPSAKSNWIQIDFVCKDCRNGIHGCAGVWTGLGLKVCCSCDCRKRAAKTGGLRTLTYGTSRRAVESQ
jgi:hypothetical protein